MLASEKVAVAAHLHVVLRRVTGRVTDTEWMAANAEYAAAMVRFAREAAAREGRPELAEWAGKLESAMGLATAPAPPPAPAAGTVPPGARPPADPDDGLRYIGGLR